MNELVEDKREDGALAEVEERYLNFSARNCARQAHESLRCAAAHAAAMPAHGHALPPAAVPARRVRFQSASIEHQLQTAQGSALQVSSTTVHHCEEHHLDPASHPTPVGNSEERCSDNPSHLPVT